MSPCCYPVLEFLTSLAHGKECVCECVDRETGAVSAALELASLVTREPAPTLSPLPLQRSHSGSSWLQAGPCGRTHIHTPRGAASPPASFLSLPPPSPCSRVHTAPPLQPRARRTRAPAPGQIPLPLPAPPPHHARLQPSRLAPALPQRNPLKAISQHPALAPRHIPRPRARMSRTGEEQSRNSTF